MIHYITGNILESQAQALVNTVNLVGVMGKGIALQFKKAYPHNFAEYKKACADGSIAIGKLLVVEDIRLDSSKIIINFPTKNDWRKPSEYIYIEQGLEDLKQVIEKHNITSIAIPPLGAGNGGLNWPVVKSMIVHKLQNLTCDIYIYEPTGEIKEELKKERVKLTDARALLLYMLFDVVRQGEDISEFSSEKVCYFLQRFGAKNIFKLDFEPKYYGPYSGKVRYVLNYLNGSYIMGYSGMDCKPFEALSIVPDSQPEIFEYIESRPHLLEIATNTMTFLNGYYSDYALELLSSVDFIMQKHGKGLSNEDIYNHLKSWSTRKGEMFADLKHIDIAKNHIISNNLL